MNQFDAIGFDPPKRFCYVCGVNLSISTGTICTACRAADAATAPQASSLATDGGASEHGGSAARTAEPPAAVRGDIPCGTGVSPVNSTALDAVQREFDHRASGAIHGLTALNEFLNRYRSRLTLRQVSTVHQQIRMLHSLMRLHGLRDAARPDDLPGSRPQAPAPQSQLVLPQKGWAGR